MTYKEVLYDFSDLMKWQCDEVPSLEIPNDVEIISFTQMTDYYKVENYNEKNFDLLFTI
ncbi:MAG: hypothetical protein UT24_C0022G0013 [Candidatus Woesebacteria bacterium GW2011_GWB1_39_12]|uniref:Uncharacterized protein n=1 Tax=Candidatus Woesebacteria bacterium GW2011_GWB1_39_12 TaxID=1618574 RepID=A0A0G0M9G8_9BACT|nr:MAG: hypothetical protein UT24_C0022G0013 [Candidatus Woesebacteria bacterium GW2011_GWB1_39_12]